MKRMPRWPLIPIALPAAVAIWSGWVGLGGLCGFGPVHVLPGINDGLTINTAICLPIGMEAYAAYALAVWLRPVPVPEDARRFAKRSAFGALALGFFGQVVFHVLTSLGWSRAPVWVTVLVSCIPVAVVGLAAALVHLMSREQEEVSEAEPGQGAVSVPVAVPVGATGRVRLPSTREIRKRQNCGPETAKKILAELRLYERGRGHPIQNGAGRAPATQRSRDGAPPESSSAVPAAKLPARQWLVDPAGPRPVNGHGHG